METIGEENVVIDEIGNMKNEDKQTTETPMELDESPKKPLTVIFCIPGNNFSNNFLYSWTELFGFCLLNNINPILSNSYDSNVFFVRNKCLMGDVLKGTTQKPFQGKIDYDYIMWIDSDQVFNVEMFKRLLSHNVDVVSGCYLMADAKHYAAVKELDNPYLLKNGTYEFLTKQYVDSWRNMEENKGKPLMEVAYCGLGFMLMKKGILEQLEYPWFKPSMSTIKDEDDNILIQYFNSEDFYICNQINNLGYKIHLDTSIIVGHEKKLIL